MLSTRTYIAIGLATFLTCLLIGMPASVVWGLVRSEVQGLPVEVSGVTGTIWNGHANVSASTESALSPYRLTWHIKPLYFLLVKGGGQFSLDAVDIKFEGEVVASLLGGGFSVNELRGFIQAPLVNKLLDTYRAKVGAGVRFSDVTIIYKGNGFKDARGELAWAGGDVTYLLARAEKAAKLPVIEGGLSVKESSLVIVLRTRKEKSTLVELGLDPGGVWRVRLLNRMATLLELPTRGGPDKTRINIERPIDCVEPGSLAEGFVCVALGVK